MKLTALGKRLGTANGEWLCKLCVFGLLAAALVWMGWQISGSFRETPDAVAFTPAEQWPIHSLYISRSGRDLWLFRQAKGLYRRNLETGLDERVLADADRCLEVAVHQDDHQQVIAVIRGNSVELQRNGCVIFAQPLDILPYQTARIAIGDAGRLVVAALESGRLLVVRLQDDRSIAEVQDVGHTIGELCLSEDGRLAAIAVANGQVLVWDLAERRSVVVLRTPHKPRIGLAWSPGGRQLATVGCLGELCVWNVNDGSLDWTGSADAFLASAVVFSPNGRLVITGGIEGRVRLWDAASGEMVDELAEQPQGIRALVCAPDGTKVYSGSSDGRVKASTLSSETSLRRW